MKRMVILAVMVAVLVVILPWQGQAQEQVECHSCCCISTSHIQEYKACLWTEMEYNWPRPYAVLRDTGRYSLYLVACSNFPVGSFSISLEYYEGLELEGVTWLDPLDEWDGVYCDSSNVAERQLRFLGWHDLGGEENRYFKSTAPHRLIKINFTSDQPILFPHWPIPRWPVRFLEDGLTGLPAFGDTTGLHWIEVRTLDGYRPDRIGPPKVAEEESQLPTEFALQQNYPNPFNAVTVIRFALPEASHVDVEVYDVLGRRVEELYSGFKPAGNHTVHWRAGHTSSGIYLYRIEAGDFTEIKRMTLVK